MSEQHVENSDIPLIPQPEPNPAALRSAIAKITPSRLKEFDRQLVEASTEAHTTQGLAPLWLMCRSWAQYVETQRHPATARRLAHLEGMVDAGDPDTRMAISEIARIQAWADAELDD